MTSEFDAYQDSYEEEVQRSIDFAGQDHAFFTEVKARVLVDLVRRRLGDPRRLGALDVGCGTGLTDALVAREFARVAGIDPSPALLERARRTSPAVDYRPYDGREIPFEDASFDLVFAINVFHHVERAAQPALAAEMARVVRPGGIVAILEHNPLNPLTRRAVSRCRFDAGVILVSAPRARQLLDGAGLLPVESRYILFFPFRGGAWRAMERGLRWLPFGAQHVAAGRKRREARR